MNQYAYDPYSPARQSNGLAVAGFVCSLVGIFTGGLLSPVGLILSLVALGRQPRGFAIAGVIIGVLGSCGIIIAIAFFSAALLALLGLAVAVAFSEPQKVEITRDMIAIAVAVEKYHDEYHYLPADLTLLNLDESTLTDPWGQRYQYEISEEDPKNDFDLICAGKDKAFGTIDDVRLSKIDQMWAASKGVHVSGGPDGGSVQIDLGGHGIDVAGNSEGGKISVTVGGKKIELTGGESGGSVDMTPAAPAPPAPPAAPQSPQPPPASTNP